MASHRIEVIDSHTGGEPTRVIISGGPALGDGPLAERRARFGRDFDRFRAAVVNEPRGNDALVGALLCEPVDPHSAAGVIFFNNVGYLGMCGHGTIGLMATLAHLGRVGPGAHLIETPVGVVEATLHDAHEVSIANVPSFRYASGLTVEVAGYGTVKGDVAWGGNWFFLVERDDDLIARADLAALTAFTSRVREALEREGITGEAGAEIDHIELCAASKRPGIDSRNFVLCPGGAYDRSPCGTGTSAKLACLHADGKLKEGEVWRQESIVGSVFEGSVRVIDGRIIPTIRGAAYVNAEAVLLVDELDPFGWGFQA